MTDYKKLENELQILEAVSQAEKGYPNWMALSCLNDEVILTKRFIELLEDHKYPVEFIGKNVVTKDVFKAAVNFIGHLYGIRTDERENCFKVAGIEDLIIVGAFYKTVYPNPQFMAWLERENPGFRERKPKYMQFPPEKPRLGLAITWEKKEIDQFAEMNGFALEEWKGGKDLIEKT
jgi:hypothetical protein